MSYLAILTRHLLPGLMLMVLPSLLIAADQGRLAELVGNGSVMLRTPDGEELISINPTQSLTPASVLKLPLAQVALTVLGEDFRFETHFYQNDADDLLVRGLGDPFLVSEEIELIAEQLAKLGISEIRRLIMDDSAFEPAPDLPIESGALDPYAARNSALAVNFNTVNLAWTPSGELRSGEPQTPLTPMARELATQVSAGTPQRINVGQNPETGLRQAQQLFSIFLEGAGIAVIDNEFYRQAVNDNWTLAYPHRSSRSLRDNLEGLLRYSNNFIANQLFLTIGAQEHGYPATAVAAREVLQQNLASLYGAGVGSDPSKLLMIEGSGLGRSQRTTAATMMAILDTFLPYADLLPEQDDSLRKSGTLTGVYNYAGYIPRTDGLYPFVILTSQPANNRDTILRLLQREIAAR